MLEGATEGVIPADVRTSSAVVCFRLVPARIQNTGPESVPDSALSILHFSLLSTLSILSPSHASPLVSRHPSLSILEFAQLINTE